MASDPPPLEDELSRPTTGMTMPLPSDAPREPAALALVAAGRSVTPVPVTPSLSLSSAADALRDEEIERTRLFIVMGWMISVIAVATVPFVEAPRVTTMLFVGGLVAGMMISFVQYRRFADPAKYTEP